jgi:hypothetical protein
MDDYHPISKNKTIICAQCPEVTIVTRNGLSMLFFDIQILDYLEASPCDSSLVRQARPHRTNQQDIAWMDTRLCPTPWDTHDQPL